ncbi:MAG: hypothetical protein A2W19_07270 [Spirochaetes bacterium RBG_16_49_21]|nr:MAG: hypothetical protein A2W19_07270 [Spirochaetes bacterium RBG_16_49_21]
MAETAALESKLYDFIDVLRDATIAISADEVLSLFTALPHIQILEKNAFKQTLKTCLIKDYTDIPIFDKCFDDFFSFKNDAQAEVVGAFRELSSREIIQDTGMPHDQVTALEKSLADFLDSLPGNLIFEKSPEELVSIFLEEMANSDSSGGMGMMLFNFRGRNPAGRQKGGFGDERMREQYGRIANAVEGMMRGRLSRNTTGAQIREREEYLLNKPIYQITPEEIKEMRDLIRRLGQKLKNRISLRKKRVKHGGIDIKRTLRTSLQYGGVPFKIFSKDRKIERPRLVVLCDISGSVNQYSRFMLLLTYTLQSLFSKVRSFAFISKIVEITPLFMEMDPERALNSIFTDTNFTYGWGSSYGRCFEQFVSDHSDSLTSKTTVLILGDGRNNYQDPGLRAFITIKERSRNLFWLNPDRRHLWSWADSIADLYAQYCDKMKEVNNFLDLSEFIDKLFIDL